MDREELEKIRRLSEHVTEGIQELQEEIKNYKSGAESFAEAVAAIKKLSEEQGKVAELLTKYIHELSEIDSGKEIGEFSRKSKEVISKLERGLGKIERSQGNLEEIKGEILEKISEEGKATRKEIWKIKREILEAVEEGKVEKKRRFRIFKRG